MPHFPLPCPADAPQPFNAADVQAHLNWILDHEQFRRAPRLSRLLRFLVERWLTGTDRDTTEYGIGIEVFDRDTASYSTGDDPIVRVQVGRLREKLRAYYAGPGRNDGIVISIPFRSYMPVIRQRGDAPHDERSGYMLAVHALRNASAAEAGTHFAHGLSDELSHRLFLTFGDHVLLPLAEAAANAAAYRLEGSVRIEEQVARVAVRLTNTLSGAIVWSEQLDREGPPNIAMQEDLARALCTAIEDYLTS